MRVVIKYEIWGNGEGGIKWHKVTWYLFGFIPIFQRTMTDES